MLIIILSRRGKKGVNNSQDAKERKKNRWDVFWLFKDEKKDELFHSFLLGKIPSLNK